MIKLGFGGVYPRTGYFFKVRDPQEQRCLLLLEQIKSLDRVDLDRKAVPESGSHDCKGIVVDADALIVECLTLCKVETMALIPVRGLVTKLTRRSLLTCPCVGASPSS